MAHFGQAGVSPDGTVGYATVTVHGQGVRRRQHRPPDHVAEPGQGAERQGRPHGRGQRHLLATCRVSRRPRRASASAWHWSSCSSRSVRSSGPSCRSCPLPSRSRSRPASRCRSSPASSRRDVRPVPGLDDRARRRHRLLAVRDQPLSRGDHPRPRSAGRRPGVGAHVGPGGPVRRRDGDHRAARPVRHADHVLQRHRGRVRRHRLHGDGRRAAAAALRCCPCWARWAFVGRMAWVTDEEAIPKRAAHRHAARGRPVPALGRLGHLPSR